LELNLTQKQIQTLSPQMMQSMEILQMGSQELLEYIEEAVQENPVLEPEERYDRADEGDQLRRKLEWLESTDPQNRYYHQQDTEEQDDRLGNYGTMEDQEDNLYYYVLSQLKVLDLPPEVMEAAGELALRLHRALGLEVYSRTDMILDQEGKLWCLEVNSLPGMTPASFVPQEAAAVGLSYRQLCEEIVNLSLAIRRKG